MAGRDDALYVPNQAAQNTFGVSSNTLRNWADCGWIDFIRTPGGQRMYNVKKFIQDNKQSDTASQVTHKRIAYCRVSSTGQRDDLERQKDYLRAKYPNHEIVTDIGSGLNFKRKGLQTILEYCFKNLVSEVVVAHKDRLCRFGFDLLEWIFHKHGARIVVLDQGNMSPEDELAGDLISIVHVFSCRINGRRKYQKNKSVVSNTTGREEKGQESTGEGAENAQISHDTSISLQEGHEDHPDMV